MGRRRSPPGALRVELRGCCWLEMEPSGLMRAGVLCLLVVPLWGFGREAGGGFGTRTSRFRRGAESELAQAGCDLLRDGDFDLGKVLGNNTHKVRGSGAVRKTRDETGSLE